MLITRSCFLIKLLSNFYCEINGIARDYWLIITLLDQSCPLPGVLSIFWNPGTENGVLSISGTNPGMDGPMKP